jgi:anti-sigma factor RsiW
LLLYLAGELEPSQTARLMRHLERCSTCTAAAEQLSETAARVEAALPTTIEAPATLDARVMEAVRGLPAPRRPWTALFPRPRLLHRLALGSAVLALMIASFFMGRWDAGRMASRPAPALDLALLGDAHRQLLSAPGTEIQTQDPQKLAQALAPLLRFPAAVVDLRPEGLRLVGGKPAEVHGVPVAALHYDWEGQRVSLFQMGTLSPPALRQVIFRSDSYFVRKVGGLTYVAWSFGGTNCVMVAQNVPMHQLFRFACHASEKLERA